MKHSENQPISARVRTSWDNFADRTTLGGVVNAYHANSWPLKIIWILIFLGLTSMTVWNTYSVAADYMTYPVVTTVAVEFSNQVPFPAVTFCNNNPVKCSKLAIGYVKNKTVLNNLFNMSGCITTVVVPPLVTKLLTINDTSSLIKMWRDEATISISQLIQQQKWTALGVTENQCDCFSKLTTVMNLTDIKNFKLNGDSLITLSSLDTNGCKGSIGKFFFPEYFPVAGKIANNIAPSVADTKCTLNINLSAGTAATQITSSSNSVALGQTTNVTSIMGNTTTNSASYSSSTTSSTNAISATASTNTNNVNGTSAVTTSLGTTIYGTTPGTTASGITTSGTTAPATTTTSGGTTTSRTTNPAITTSGTTGYGTTISAASKTTAGTNTSVTTARTITTTGTSKTASTITTKPLINASGTINNGSAPSIGGQLPPVQGPSAGTTGAVGPQLTGGLPPTSSSFASGSMGYIDPTTADDQLTESEEFIAELVRLRVKQLYNVTELLVPFEDFILSCSYKIADCKNISNFHSYFAAEYGACYTFNSQYTVNDPYNGSRTSTLTGSLYGFSVNLMLNQNEYVPNAVASGAGARIAINSPGLRPYPFSEGHFIKPNSETDFALRLLTLTRLPDPYQSKCWQKWTDSQQEMEYLLPQVYSSLTNQTKQSIATYSYNECQLLCASKRLFNACRCINPHYAYPFKFSTLFTMDTEKMQICSTIGGNSKCVADVLNEIESGTVNCPCHLPCSDNYYETISSSRTWPSNKYMPKMIRKYGSKLESANGKKAGTVEDSVLMEQFEQEFLRVNVYFQSLDIENIDEVNKYDTFGALGSLGGALSLYLGTCGITMFEILEFGILAFLAVMGYSTQGNNNDGRGEVQRAPMNKVSNFIPATVMYNPPPDQYPKTNMFNF